MKFRRNLLVSLAATIALLGATTLRAQAPAGTTEIGEGNVLHRVGETLVVDVKKGPELGMHRFQIKAGSDIVFFKNGRQVDVFAINEGDYVVAYKKTSAGSTSTIISSEEVAQIATSKSPVAATPVASASSATSSPEAKPTTLPKTASELPLLLVLGAGLLAAGVTLGRMARG
jgi:hypothetical protein